MTYRYPGGLVRRTAANTSITGASGVWDLGSQAQAVKTNTWPISGLANPVSGSLRFRASASAYLNRTMTTATNNLKWTWSAWVKRGKLADTNIVFNAGDGSSDNFGAMQFTSSDTLQFSQTNGGSYNIQMVTSAVFRDPSAWYHVVLIYDSPNATSTDRVQIYVNGTRQSVTYVTGPFAQNTSSKINSALTHYISKLDYASLYFNGYMAEVNFIDGQALTPSSFGQTSPITGVWEPIKYTGTYGTNGFYLSLSDTSSIGKDFSGNGNNWTPNNISTASGSTFDLMRDVPTQWAPQGVTDVGGTVRGNYATLNPIDAYDNAPTQGNLARIGVGHTGSPWSTCRGTMGVTSGKWYFEATLTGSSGSYQPNSMVGVMTAATSALNDAYGGSTSRSYQANGGLQGDNSTGSVSSAVSGDVIMCAFDIDAGKVWFGKNGTFFNSGVPASGTGNVFTSVPTTPVVPAVHMYGNTGDNNGWYLNFGQQPFAYTPPSGFKSLCTTNLPTPTIGATTANASNKYFETVVYSGNSPSSQTITVGFQPDFVWQKSRGQTYNHTLYDAVRGATKEFYSNNTDAETTDSNGLTAFTSNGFTVGSDGELNDPTANHVAWNWNAGGSTVTNTTGSISSQVRANPTAGFSIVTYTGTGSNATVGHGLGVAPSWIITRYRGVESWAVYHKSTGNTQYLTLNTTNAAASASTVWQNTLPTSTVFSVGTAGLVNTSGGSGMVAYCFAEVAGYSAFGSYTGNGSSDGPFVFTGFRPRYVMLKRTNTTGDWIVYDAARSTYNGITSEIYPNLSNAEDNSNVDLDFVSNGIKFRNSGFGVNGSGDTYIYMAFAEAPFKYARSR